MGLLRGWLGAVAAQSERRTLGRKRPAAALISVILALPSTFVLVPPAAAQSGNPLSPGLPQQSATIPSTTTPTVTAAPTTTTAGGSGVSGTGAVMVAIGALVILSGISFFIWRDARRRAPVRSRTGALTDDSGGRSGSKPRAKPRKLSQAERRRRKRGRAR